MSEQNASPRTTTRLIGRDGALADFQDALAADRLHHAWLIAGPRGTGKATLAYHIARALLAEEWDIPPEHPVFRRVTAGSLADLLVLEPPFDPEKDETRREIPIEQAREVGGFLALTAAEGARRIVIIDSVDELNANGANAILKVLEEPPPGALLLLVSHHPGRLLPTIRSRCRMLKVPALGGGYFSDILQNNHPELSHEEIECLGALSGYSPGVSEEILRLDGMELYAALVNQVANIGKGGLLSFAEGATAAPPHARWQLLSQLMTHLLSRAMEKALSEGLFHEITPGEAAACDALLAATPPHALAERYSQAVTQFSMAARLHLDYKTVLMTYLHGLSRPIAA